MGTKRKSHSLPGVRRSLRSREWGLFRLVTGKAQHLPLYTSLGLPPTHGWKPEVGRYMKRRLYFGSEFLPSPSTQSLWGEGHRPIRDSGLPVGLLRTAWTSHSAGDLGGKRSPETQGWRGLGVRGRLRAGTYRSVLSSEDPVSHPVAAVFLLHGHCVNSLTQQVDVFRGGAIAWHRVRSQRYAIPPALPQSDGGRRASSSSSCTWLS